MTLLANIIKQALDTGEPQVLSPKQSAQFQAEIVKTVVPKIEKIRAKQTRAYANCRKLVVD